MSQVSLRKNLNRGFNRRRALVKSLANDLIMYEKIDTTLPRAKATQSFVERLVTKSREDTLNNRRAVEKALGLNNTVKKMFDLIGPKFKERSGGYTRVIKIGNKKGDDSVIARLQFTELVTQIIKEPKEVKVTEEKPSAVAKVLGRKPKITVKKTTKAETTENKKVNRGSKG